MEVVKQHNVTAAHITETPRVCGGKPCIAGRRIHVSQIYQWHEILGISADAIANKYDLTLAQVHAALTFAFEHIDLIKAELRENEVIVAESMNKHPSRLKGKMPRE